MAEDKIIKTSSLHQVLTHLFEWMPFKKTKSGIQLGTMENNQDDVILGVGDKVNHLNTLEVRKDGKVYILDVDEGKQKPLQDLLTRKESIVINTQREWDSQKYDILNTSNFGTIVYLGEDIYERNSLSYKSGVYIISINASDHGNAMLSKLATTSSVSEDYGDAIAQLEDKVQDTQYDVTELNRFKDSPITNPELERITGIDIDGDGRIG